MVRLGFRIRADLRKKHSQSEIAATQTANASYRADMCNDSLRCNFRLKNMICRPKLTRRSARTEARDCSRCEGCPIAACSGGR
jgi:hypothetical protein